MLRRVALVKSTTNGVFWNVTPCGSCKKHEEWRLLGCYAIFQCTYSFAPLLRPNCTPKAAYKFGGNSNPSSSQENLNTLKEFPIVETSLRLRHFIADALYFSVAQPLKLNDNNNFLDCD
jgi:hypothetical protein